MIFNIYLPTPHNPTVFDAPGTGVAGFSMDVGCGSRTGRCTWGVQDSGVDGV